MDDHSLSPIPSPTRSIQSVRTPPVSSPPAPFPLIQEPLLPPSHLQYLTWEEYEIFDPPAEFSYEIFDGLVVHKPMTLPPHDLLQNAIWHVLRTAISNTAYVNTTIQVLPSSSSADASSSSLPLSNQKDLPNIRVPDVVASFQKTSEKRTSTSPTASTSSDAVQERVKKYCNEHAIRRVLYPAGRLVTFVFEVTSQYTRNVDLNRKWMEYAEVGVKYYVIVDLACPHESDKSIIVGSREKKPNWERSTTGDPEEAPKKPDDSSNQIHYYYKRFQGSEIVNVGELSELNLTAKDWLSASTLEEFVKKRAENDKRRAGAAEKAKEAETRRADAAEKAKEAETRRADDAEKRADELRK